MKRYANLRDDIDPIFRQAAQELSDAYYQHWKHGQSFPWLSWDMLTKQQFDEVHGALWHVYELTLLKYAEQKPTPKIEQMADHEAVSRAWLSPKRAQWVPMVNELRSRLQAAGINVVVTI